MTDPNIVTANSGRSLPLRARLAIAALALLAALLLLSAAPRPAMADSYYNVDGCYSGTLTWGSWNDWEGGTDGNGQGSSCGVNLAYLLESTQNDTGLAGHGYDHLEWFAYAPSGTSLSGISGNSANFNATEGTQAGWADDTSSNRGGFFYTNGTESVIAYDPGVTPDCANNPGTSGCYLRNAYDFTNHGLPGGTQGIALAVTTNECGLYTNGCSTANVAADADVQNVTVDDPYNAPAISATGASFNQSQWYSAAKLGGGSLSAGMSASDPGGVCDTWEQLSGPGGTIASTGNVGAEPANHQGDGSFNINLGTTSPSAPCATSGSQTLSVSAATIGSASPGTYAFDAIAQNPANVNGGDLSDNVQVASLNIDNTVPQLTISGGNGKWSSNNNQSYDVEASTSGPSGIASITCTGVGLPAGGRTWSGSSATINETANGDDAITCTTISNAGVTSNAVGTEGQSNDILIDATAPTIALDADNTAITSPTASSGGTWDAATQTLNVYGTAGDSGIADSSNPLDNLSGANTSTATIGGQTVAMPYCTVTDNNNPGAGPYVVTDTQTGSSTWPSGDNWPATAALDTAGNHNEWQIPFNQTGSYTTTCVTTNGAGVQTTPLVENIQVDLTTPNQLADAAQTATDIAGANDDGLTGSQFNTWKTADNNGDALDYDTGAGAANYVSTVSQSTPAWSGDALKLFFTPADGFPAADTITDPIVSTTCTPGGADTDAARTQTNGNPLEVTIGDTSGTSYTHDNGADSLTCVEANAAGTTTANSTSNGKIYYVNLDQQVPQVAYAQPAGDTGGQNTSSIQVAQTPNALAQADGVKPNAFSLPTLAAKVTPTASNPVPQTGHLAAQPADQTGVDWSNTATQVNATPTEQTPLSGIGGLFCTDTNATTGQSNQYLNGGAANLAPTGGTATLSVPTTSVDTTGIHNLSCAAQDDSVYVPGPGQQPQQYPDINPATAVNNSTVADNYPYLVDVDAATPSAIAFSNDQGNAQPYVPDTTLDQSANPVITDTADGYFQYDPNSSGTPEWSQNTATVYVNAASVEQTQQAITQGLATAAGDQISDISCTVSYLDPTTGQVTQDSQTVNQQPVDSTTNWTIPVTVSADQGNGTYFLSCYAQSGAQAQAQNSGSTQNINGNVATAVLNIQNTGSPGCTNSSCPPPPCNTFCQTISPELQVPPSGYTGPGTQPKWSTAPEPITVTAQVPTGSAPIQSITCNEPPADLNATAPAGVTIAQGTDNGDGTITYPNPAGSSSLTEQITIMVGPPGGTLMCYATDSSNQTLPIGAQKVDIDDLAPTGHINALTNNNPAQISAQITDNGGSGVAKVQIQLVDNASGAVTTIPLDATSPSSGDGTYTATIPNDGIDMPQGNYTIQAKVSDLAGNNGVINTLANGGGPHINLPVGDKTSMFDAIAAGNVAPPLPGTTQTAARTVKVTKKIKVKVHGKTVTKTVYVYITKREKIHGKLRTVKVIKTKKVKNVLPATAASINKPVKLAYGATATADGIVTTAAGMPIAGGTVTISQTIAGQTTATVLATVKTNAQGVWIYHIKPGPSRTLSFLYTGTVKLRAANGTDGATQVTGSITIKAPGHAIGGRKITISGLIRGGYIPKKGVALRLYYTVKGAGNVYGSYNETYHTTSKGKYQIKLPSIRKTAVGRTYYFWVQAIPQDAWPYVNGTSKRVTVKYR